MDTKCTGLRSKIFIFKKPLASEKSRPLKILKILELIIPSYEIANILLKI